MAGNEGGAALEHLRDTRGWTRDELADLTDGDVSPSTILNYEEGRTKPTKAKVVRLAQAFGGQDGVWLLEQFDFVDDARMMADREERRGRDGDFARIMLETLQRYLGRENQANHE